jgi:hypothetical protein
MAKEFNAELAEKVRAEMHREASERWIELEQKRLNDIFATLGGIEHSLPNLNFSQSDEFSTLAKVRSRVEAGDRKAMELLTILSSTFRVFESLPQDVREALADGVEKMGDNLKNSEEFLPRRPGPKNADREEEFATAFQVEKIRHQQGKNLSDAIADVVEKTGLSESLVHKRWKRQHKEAKGHFEGAAILAKALQNFPELAGAMQVASAIAGDYQAVVQQRTDSKVGSKTSNGTVDSLGHPVRQPRRVKQRRKEGTK